jgi:very-short-patch-repair endonuclease
MPWKKRPTNTARKLRRTQTQAEARLWFHLRSRRFAGHKFRRQSPVGPYIVDFICLQDRLVIEVDGGHHAERSAEDAGRSAYLETQGFRVLRFWNNDVLGNIEGVLSVIMNAISPPSGAS